MLNLLIVSDAGKDQDDELMLLLLAQLVRQGCVNLLAIVANLAPARLRARLIKGQLKKTALACPVGVGTACGLPLEGHDHEFAQVGYLADESELVEGAPLLVQKLTEAPDASVTLLLVSGMTDAADLLRANEALVRQKVAQVVVMGGVNRTENAVTLDAAGLMTPDTAANNNFDMPAAEFLYKRLQELGVPLVVLSRNASYAAKVPRAAYDLMAATGHEVGVKLCAAQKTIANAFWRVVSLPADHPERGKLPARWTREWFVNTFCDGAGLERSGEERIDDLVKHVIFSDPMALLAAAPELRARFFTPTVVTVGGVEHLVIGVSPDVTGVKDVQAVATYMVDAVVGALVGLDVPPATLTLGS